MGNKSSSEGGRIPRSPSGARSTLTSAEDLEAWLPDSIEKLRSGTLPPNRDVDWQDERLVMKETQVPGLTAALLHPRAPVDFFAESDSQALRSSIRYTTWSRSRKP